MNTTPASRNDGLTDRQLENALSRLLNGEPNTHDPYDLPSIVFGNAYGKLKTGRHMNFEMRDYTPQGNLLVSLMDLVGVPIDKLGDSTGRLGGLVGL